MGNPKQSPLLARIADCYDIDTNVLGEGSYGQVTKCTRKSTGLTFACKTIKKSQQPHFQKEVTILNSMDHPNIIKLHDSFEGLCKAYFILDLCEGGDLYDRVTERNAPGRPGHFTEEETAIVMKSVFDAVSYMHKHYICHRDLKLENVMCTTRDSISSTQFKVIDFGTACECADGEWLTGKVGSNHYLAPQVWKGQYDCSSDLWSLGVMTYILLGGVYPFKGAQETIVGKLKFEGAAWKCVSEDAKKLIRNLLMVDPAERYTAEEALADAWVENLSDPSFVSKEHADETPRFAVGDRVEVKPSVKEPQYGWSDVRHGMIGVITEIDDEDGSLEIDFDHFEGWGADPEDMQLADVALGIDRTCSTRTGDLTFSGSC